MAARLARRAFARRAAPLITTARRSWRSTSVRSGARPHPQTPAGWGWSAAAAGVAGALAGLAGAERVCRCEQPSDGAQAPRTEGREGLGRPGEFLKKAQEEKKVDETPPPKEQQEGSTKPPPDKEGDDTKKSADAKPKPKPKAKPKPKPKAKPKVVATPRIDPLLELQITARTIYLSGSIDDLKARQVVSQLLYLDAVDEREGLTKPRPITMIINSGGGIVTSGLAIYDVMQYIDAPVHTLCVGHASSMAAILLAAGAPGQRRALPHSRIMIHQASGGYGRNKVEDVLVHAEELRAKNELLAGLLAKHLGVSTEQVLEMWKIDKYMTPAQAQELKLVDEVIERKPRKPQPQQPQHGTAEKATQSEGG